MKATGTLEGGRISLEMLEAFFGRHLDLKVKDSAINGIQIENSRGVSHLAVGVDFCAELIEEAVAKDCDALLVHHGMYWGAVEALRERRYHLVRKMILHDIALIAIHLPLDLHPTLSNNAGLIDALGLKQGATFGEYKGVSGIFFEATPHPGEELSFNDFTKRYKDKIGEPIRAFKFHDQQVRRIGICSGGGLFDLEAVWRHGCDTLLTGDAHHICVHQAKELPMNLLCGGHYLTETFGVERLAEKLKEELKLPFTFFDLPTSL